MTRADLARRCFWRLLGLVILSGLTESQARQSRLWGQLPRTLAPASSQFGVATEVAERTAAATGLRQLRSRHLLLTTDLPSSPEIDQLPAIFDQALPQWCAYFGVDEQAVQDWHVQGYLMGVETRFQQAGQLPADLPPFLHGYQRGDEFWLREQPRAYYRRHLLLHEGTHAFMHQVLKRGGPGWYLEGLAELLATHRWQLGRLTLNVLPATKEDVPEWGRIKLIRAAVAEGRALSLVNVMGLTNRDFQSVEGYAWSWAATAFLDGHPLWHSTFRGWSQPPARAQTADEFTALAWQELQRTEAPVEEAWQLFIHEIDYGYQVAADQIHYLTDSVAASGLRPPWQADVDVTRGWQATPIVLQAGQRYRLTATGRYTINQRKPAWPVEAGGVTLRYQAGRPWGILLGAIRSDALADPAQTPLVQPEVWGAAAILEPQTAGRVFVRVNDPAGERADNQGQLRITIEPLVN